MPVFTSDNSSLSLCKSASLNDAEQLSDDLYRPRSTVSMSHWNTCAAFLQAKQHAEKFKYSGSSIIRTSFIRKLSERSIQHNNQHINSQHTNQHNPHTNQQSTHKSIQSTQINTLINTFITASNTHTKRKLNLQHFLMNLNYP